MQRPEVSPAVREEDRRLSALPPRVAVDLLAWAALGRAAPPRVREREHSAGER